MKILNWTGYGYKQEYWLARLKSESTAPDSGSGSFPD